MNYIQASRPLNSVVVGQFFLVTRLDGELPLEELVLYELHSVVLLREDVREGVGDRGRMRGRTGE